MDHRTSKIVKSRQIYRNGHLPSHFYFVNCLVHASMHICACEFACTVKARRKIRGDTKTLNLLGNIVSLQVLGRCFAFLTLRDKLFAQQKHSSVSGPQTLKTHVSVLPYSVTVKSYETFSK